MRNAKFSWKATILTVLMLVWVCSMAALAEGASGDNSLSSLGITTEGVTVSPEFYYSTIEYKVTVPAGTARLELDPVTSNPNAWIVDITGQDIENGETTVVITVSAENGSQYAYYLYVTTDESAQAPGTAETEPQTEPQTEKQTETEPETEDPRYVRVDRNSLQEAENTISALKTETGHFRDRLSLLMKILYGLIGLCVILLFVVINLILKKKDLKAELQEYMSYGYPDADYPAEGQKDAGGSYGAAQGYTEYQESGSDGNGYAQEQPYSQEDLQAEEPVRELSRKEKKKAAKMQDDPATVPKPSKARKKTKQMPEYQAPEPEHQYQPPQEATSEHVEINMIDL